MTLGYQTTALMSYLTIFLLGMPNDHAPCLCRGSWGRLI